MSSKILNIGESTDKNTTVYHIVKQYLHKKYDMRCNIIKNRIEVSPKDKDKWTQAKELNLLGELVRSQGLKIGLDKFCHIIGDDWCSAPCNPLINYFEGLPTPKKDHISELASFVNLKDQNDYPRFVAMLTKWTVSTIKCALEERHYNKQCFVLHGEQGTMKTPFLRHLLPQSLNDYSTENPSFQNNEKDAKISMVTNLFVGFDELDKFSSMNQAHVKAIMTLDKINERLPYARVARQMPRRCSFWATCNKDDFLRDETGSKRFIVFTVQSIDKLVFLYDIDLFWSSVYKLYKDKYNCYLTDEELQINEDINAAYKHVTSEFDLLQQYFEPAKRGEGEFLNTTEILTHIQGQEPNIRLNSITLGRALKDVRNNFEQVAVKSRGVVKRGHWVYKITT